MPTPPHDGHEVREIAFWKTDPHHRPESDSFENIVNKFKDIAVFFPKVRAFAPYFERAKDILEMGGGQCWASCVVKRLYPDKKVSGTDIAEAAVASVGKWESILGVRLDRAKACQSYRTPFEDGSFDLIFTFQSAHHFRRHRSTLLEVRRLLRPGGAALYLSEPGCRRYIYPLALKRVNWSRPAVPEDVLVYKHIQRMGEELGLDIDVRFDTHTENRGLVEGIYFHLLGRMTALCDYLPCGVDIVIRKA